MYTTCIYALTYLPGLHSIIIYIYIINHGLLLHVLFVLFKDTCKGISLPEKNRHLYFITNNELYS